jgi:hypothetical protein
MKGDNGTMESVLSGAGITVAAALVMLMVIALYRSTGPADAAILLQTAAGEVCGDIGTVAISALPYARSEAGYTQGIDIRISSDYVVAGTMAGTEFARPLAVRVYPGNYQGPEGVSWNDTAGMREYFNVTFGQPGTKESPLDVNNGSLASALLEKASLDMAIHPVCMDWFTALTIEKLFLYTYNDSSHTTRSEPYVFVYQR